MSDQDVAGDGDQWMYMRKGPVYISRHQSPGCGKVTVVQDTLAVFVLILILEALPGVSCCSIPTEDVAELVDKKPQYILFQTMNNETKIPRFILD